MVHSGACAPGEGYYASPADLRHADLRNVHLQWAELRRALLECADLRRADIRNADLVDADLPGVLFTGANLGENETSTTLIPPWRAEELSRKRRQEPDIPPYSGVALNSMNELLWIMRREDWSGEPTPHREARADLREIDVSGFDLNGADLTGAVWTSTRLIKDDRERELRDILARNGQSQPIATPCKGAMQGCTDHDPK